LAKSSTDDKNNICQELQHPSKKIAVKTGGNDTLTEAEKCHINQFMIHRYKVSFDRKYLAGRLALANQIEALDNNITRSETQRNAQG
jgi:soluble P-type ATPase